MGVAGGAWRIVRAHRRAYISLNVTYYGLVALAMMYVAVFNPAVQGQLLGEVQASLTEGPLATVGGVYLGGNVPAAAVLTFLVNLLVGAILTVTLPSLIVPFAGIALGAYRAVVWGLLLAPTTSQLALVMIPHSLTLILEARATYWPSWPRMSTAWPSCASRAWAWRATGRATWRALSVPPGWYVLVVIVLAVAAVYEAVEVIAMVWVASGGA